MRQAGPLRRETRQAPGQPGLLTILCFRPEVLYEMLKENQKQESFEFGRDIIPMMMERKLQGVRIQVCGLLGIYQDH